MPFWFTNVSVSPVTKLPIDAVAEAICVSSASESVIVLSITAAAACSVYPSVTPAVSTGASATAWTVIVLLAVLLAVELLSVTTTEMVRDVLVLFEVGSSELELYCTERSNVSYVPLDAAPVAVSTPVALL